MFNRVTTSTMMHSASQNMRSAGSRLAQLQDQAGTQKSITRPSDDPSGTAAAMKIRADQKANVQYTRNTADGNEWLTTVDSTLQDVSALVQKASDLTLQASNSGTMSPESRKAIAAELVTIRESLLGAANTQYLGRSVFAGNSDAAQAFERPDVAGGAYGYNPGSGVPVTRRVADGVEVRVDADGAAIFGVDDLTDKDNGPTSIFADIDTIVKALTDNTPVSGYLPKLGTRLNSVIGNLAASGARQATLIAAADTQSTKKVELESQRASIEDVDLAEVILELKMQETVYQAALAVTARALQPTLMDFLR